MKPGRQWVIWDADFFFNGLCDALLDRFGWAGPALFNAFICACKRSLVQGQISYGSEVEALQLLGLYGRQLVDDEGNPWTLDEFWAFTGRYKQTHRTARGRRIYVRATRWEQWQNSQNTAYERERKRRWRADSVRDNVPPEREREREREKWGGTSPGKATPKPEPPDYPEWIPDQPADEPLVNIKDALGQLRRGEEVDG